MIQKDYFKELLSYGIYINHNKIISHKKSEKLYNNYYISGQSCYFISRVEYIENHSDINVGITYYMSGFFKQYVY